MFPPDPMVPRALGYDGSSGPPPTAPLMQGQTPSFPDLTDMVPTVDRLRNKLALEKRVSELFSVCDNY